MPFLEERLPVCVKIGAQFEDSYFTNVVRTSNGGRYASLQTGLPYRTFDVGYVEPNTTLAVELAGLYHRAYGEFAGFRVKCWDDFTTANDGRSPFSALDCTLDLVSAGVYQLVKEYGRDKPGLVALGRPRRTIFKPVSGQVAIGISGSELPAGQWSVDASTGLVSLVANKTASITGITQASSAVLEVGANTFLVGESVGIIGVSGMTEINGLRALITAKPDSTHITVAINTSLFSAYTSGGTVQTHPVSGEVVTGGCEFDIPCAFDSAFSVTGLQNGFREVSSQRLVEILNPLD